MKLTGGAQVAILRSGEDGATLPSLHLNVSSSLKDNDASSFLGSSLHLHTSLRCSRAKMWIWRCQNFWEDLDKIGKTFFQSRGAKKSKISNIIEVLERDGVKIVLVQNNF
jgi:hypothetical protein